MHARFAMTLALFGIAIATAIATVAGDSATSAQPAKPPVDGPLDQGTALPQTRGDAAAGRDVFRFETFGNEGFWTDAVRLPAGIIAAKVTPMQALKLGLQIDADMLDAATKAQLAAELQADPTGKSSKLLNDPTVTMALVKAGAVIGMAPKGDRVGTSCALCHTMSDASVFKVKEGGSIGSRVDGLANHNLQVGKIFATAANTRALYTVAQLSLKANHGKTLGRAPKGLTAESSEADFDAYFGNPDYYPVGMFDDTFDGNGNPMHNTPMFRADLSAPYGSEGTFTKIDDFSNLVFTTLLDQTMLTTPGGRAFVHKLAGAAGDEMIDNYVKILAATKVTGYPYVSAQARQTGAPGALATPIGFRVDNAKLLDLNAYLISLQAPRGVVTDAGAVTRGRGAFIASGCTGCHNINQGRAVPTTVHPMAMIWPGDKPVILAQRDPPLTPVMNTPIGTFDDKWAVVNASLRGEKRGVAMPLLLGLATKPVFLHDDSVKSLDKLLSKSRGATAPHPFYVVDAKNRAEVVAYLNSLDTNSR